MEIISIWTYLSQTEKPIIVYGMGDGAEKILSVFEQYEIKVSGFMASDEFVRGHSFHGFEVKKLCDIEEQFDDFIIIIAFGTSRTEVLERIYNLDSRYELYAPDVPVYGNGLFNEEYISENIKLIDTVKNLFADKKSKEVFEGLIEYRLSGNINVLRDITSPREEIMELLNIKKNGTETFVDLGAYDGDTVEEFLKYTDMNFKKIYALEPDTKNYMKLRRRMYKLGSEKFIPLNVAAGRDDGFVDFSDRNGRNSSRFGNKNLKQIPARSVNSICGTEKVTLIKYDVEGSEVDALHGSSEIIKLYRPKLIVSAYHKTEDLLELPVLIRKLNHKYKLYLRHHEYIPAWDTNFYCV